MGNHGTIVHYNGHAWALVPSGTTEYLNGVYGTGPKDAWIVSGSGTVLHWDGTAWTALTRIDGAQLLSVWADGPTDVWAVGIDLYSGSSGLVTHWDGTTWTTADVPGSTSLWGAWGSGRGDVWLVGEANQLQGLVLRGSGTPANPFNTASFDGGPVRSIYGTGPSDVWVAPYQGAIEHWNGSSWTKASMAAAHGALLGIAASGTDEVWAVGLNGVALHDHAGTWSASMTGSSAVLWGVWTSARDDVWVAGGGATVLRWNGTAWF